MKFVGSCPHPTAIQEMLAIASRALAGATSASSAKGSSPGRGAPVPRRSGNWLCRANEARGQHRIDDLCASIFGLSGIVVVMRPPRPHIYLAADLSPDRSMGGMRRRKAFPMFKTKQFSDQATEYRDLGNKTDVPAEARAYQKLEQSFTVLADNEQWLADNHD